MEGILGSEVVEGPACNGVEGLRCKTCHEKLKIQRDVWLTCSRWQEAGSQIALCLGAKRITEISNSALENCSSTRDWGLSLLAPRIQGKVTHGTVDYPEQ